MKKKLTRLFSVLLAAVLVFGTLPVSAMGTDVADPPASAVDDTSVDVSAAEPEEEASAVDETPDGEVETQSAEDEIAVQSIDAVDGYDMNIFSLDCGRKYYSVETIEKFITIAHDNGFNYIQLDVGNDGMRFLLDDMSLTANNVTYESDNVKNAIHQGNTNYKNTERAEGYTHNPDALTEDDMDEIIEYAHGLNMGVIPCINSPGHMNAILDAAEELMNGTYSYSESESTIDVTKSAAVAFTQALLQKYIDYFAGMGCKYFNMGADEFANDTSVGFAGLQKAGEYGYYIEYINGLAQKIKDAGMTPMAFNDGIYYNNGTGNEDIDTDILICYWSCGWSGYDVISADSLRQKGFKLINTNDAYYWALGNSTYQCDATMASQFVYNKFAARPGDNAIISPKGSMFCVWSDYPSRATDSEVYNSTNAAIAAFGQKCPDAGTVTEVPVPDNGAVSIKAPTGANTLLKNGTTTLTANKKVTWSVDDDSVVSLASADAVAAYSGEVTAKKVTVTAIGAGKATITAADAETGSAATFEVTVADTTATKTATIDLVIGQSKKEHVTEAYTGEYATDDTSIATVSVAPGEIEPELQEVTALTSGEQYLIANKSSGKLLTGSNSTSNGNVRLPIDGEAVATNEAQLWTYSGNSGTGTLKHNNGYLTIGNSTASVGTTQTSIKLAYNASGKYWTISRTVRNYGLNQTYYLNNYNNNGYAIGRTNASTADASKWIIYKIIPGSVSGTDITFTGESEGTTHVTIGDTYYTINVTAETGLSSKTKTIEYWNTNAPVHEKNNTSAKSTTVSADKVNSKNGVALSTLVPELATSKYEKEVAFWKGTRLTSDNKQIEDGQTGSVDKSDKGDDFMYIRYWGGKWSFSSDQSTWYDFNNTDQIVAYYMQRTKVTPEVTTDIVDWGPDYAGYTAENFVILDFARAYESGDKVPNTFPVAGKTVAFHCDSGDKNTVHTDSSNNTYRTLGSIRAVNSDDYEVYMITLTPSSDDNKASASVANKASEVESITYGGTEKVVWVDDAKNIPERLSGKTADGYTEGGEPFVKSLNIYNKHAMLVTYYIREIVKEDSLTVNYVVEGDEAHPFHTYNINVKSGTFFADDIGLDTPWKGPLKNGTVTNINDVEQTVSADLSTMDRVPSTYSRANYTCVRVKRSDDGKTVTLYYTFNTTASFVVDFGTPLTITKEQVSENLAGANLDSVTILSETVSCGSAVVNDDYSVTYTPDERFAKSEEGDTFRVEYKGTQKFTNEDGEIEERVGTVQYTIHIRPASNVLYEENFLTGADGWKQSEDFGSHTNAQQTQKAGDTDKNVFGYDASYAGDKENNIDPVTGQNGAWTIDGLSTSKASSALTTSFYGNTFDLIGNCAPDTGRVMALISEDGANRVRIVDIDTRYNDGKIYQVPLAHEKLSDDNRAYSVKIYASGLAAKSVKATTPNGIATMSLDDASVETDDLLTQVLEENGLSLDDVEYVSVSAMDNVNATATVDVPGDAVATYADDANTIEFQAGTHVEINGFRVYRSTTDDVAKNNYPSNEQSVNYWNIIDVMHGQVITAYRDNVTGEYSEIAVENYQSAGGPQNEIYLLPGQSIAFAIDRVDSVQVSLHSVQEENATAWNSNAITSNAEMYYKLNADEESGYFVIANTADTGILGIGNVKIPNSKTESDITAPKDMNQNALKDSILAVLNGDTEEPEVFTPKTFTAKTTSTPVIRNKVVTLKVNVSSDVAYITVNGVKYTRTGLQGLFQATRTIRVVNTVPKNQTKTYEIVAYNADGVASETITVTG